MSISSRVNSLKQLFGAMGLFMAAFLFAGLIFPLDAQASEEWGYGLKGECGECVWTLSDSGELVIASKEGTAGKLPDLSSNVNNGSGHAPWDGYRDEIKSVRFEGKVTASRGYRTNDIGEIFGGCRNLVDVDLTGLSLGGVTNLSNAFYGCESLEYLDLSPLDVTKVDQAYEMLQGCKKLTSFVLGDDWAAGGGLFGDDDCNYWMHEADGIAYSHWDVPDHPSGAFKKMLPGFASGQWYSQGTCKWCVGSDGVLCIEPLDGIHGALGQWHDVVDSVRGGDRVPGWCVSTIRSKIKKVRFRGVVSAETCENMFCDLTNLREVDFKGLDLSGTTSMRGMFKGCLDLEELLFPSALMTNNVDAALLCQGCPSLKRVDFQGLAGCSFSSFKSMFEGCSELSSIQMSGLRSADVDSIEKMFAGCSSLRSIDLSGGSFLSTESCSEAFAGCRLLEAIDFAPGSFKNVSDFRSMFSGCTALTSPGIERIDFSSGEDLGYLFEGCSSLASIDLSPLSSCFPHQIECMLSGCSKLISIDLSPLNPLFVNTIDGLLEGCSSLKKADLSPFDGCELMSMRNVFRGCSNLRDVRLPRIEYAGGGGESLGLDALFENCCSLVKISLESLHITNGSHASFDDLFSGCSRLESADISSLADDGNGSWIESDLFEGCSSLHDVVVGDRIKMSEGQKRSILPDGYWQDVTSGAVYAAIDVPSYHAARYRRAFIANFSDVSSSTPHSEDIRWLASAGVSKGWDEPDGTKTFRPYVNVARADMAAFLYRLVGSPDYTPTASESVKFCDVDSSTPHAKEIWWLASTGVSTGWDMGGGVYEFRPYARVARADMAAFLYRLAGSPSFKPSASERAEFCDVKAGIPHANEILWLASSGISKGWSEANGAKTFRPYTSVARADMAAFLHRMSDNGLLPVE